MKKLVFGGLFLSAIVGGFVACKKEVLTPTNSAESTNAEVLRFNETYHVASTGKMLVFESAGSYSETIGKADSAYQVNFLKTVEEFEHTSFLEDLIERKSDSNPVEDDYLASILNKDQIVQIGDYLYRVNIADEKVFVLPAENIEQYSDLKGENTKNKNIAVYSTGDDVIDLVEKGKGSEVLAKCGERRARGKSQHTPEKQVNQNPLVRMYVTAQYFRGGIINSLKSEAYYMSNLGGNLRYYFQLSNCTHKVRCRGYHGPYSHPWRTRNGGAWNGGAWKREVFRLYQGSRQLTRYNYTVRLRCENWYFPSGTNPYSVIFTDWVNITDY